MPAAKVYRHGVTAFMVADKHTRKPGKRGNTTGWSKTATRNNIRWLRSVDERHLPGQGLALTLTIRDCPLTPEDWANTRRKFLKRINRLGCIRLHWVTEWQKRGFPHLHIAAYFPPLDDQVWEPVYLDGDKLKPVLLRDIVDAWMASAWHLRPEKWVQDVRPIHEAVGWFQYVAKHQARGVHHYQRSSENMPAAWSKTGRVWGHTGDWCTQEPIKLDIDHEAIYQFRRLMRRWRCSQKAVNQEWKALAHARRMLKCSDKEVSSYLGVSEWFPQDVSLQVFDWLKEQGRSVEQGD